MSVATATATAGEPISSWDSRIGADDLLDDGTVLDPLAFVREQNSTGLVGASLNAGRTMKWNPGHYIEFGSNAGDFMIEAGIEEARQFPFVKGIMVRADWAQLEKGRGEYDFSRIDRYLNKAAAKGERFFLTLGTKNFGGAKAVPDYLRQPWFSGGAFKITTAYGGSGENAALYDDDVRDRLIALIQELGKRYNRHNYFEGITFTETAFGQTVRPLTDAQKEKMFSNLAKINTAARQAFPNTVVLQFVNYPAKLVPALFTNMLDKGVGMGGPDVFVNDPALERSAYVWNVQAKGRVPIGMKVESDCYARQYHGGPIDPPNVREIYRYARDRLYSNYVFWYRDISQPRRPWGNVLNMFRGEAFPTGGTGGLDSACPAKFGNCASKLPS